MKISKSFSFDYGHALDLTRQSKCKAVHGHTGKVTIEFAGVVTDEGMVRDYSSFPKEIVMALDHHFLVAGRHVKHYVGADFTQITIGEIQMTLPNPTVYVMHDVVNSTAEEIAKHLYNKLHVQGFDVSQVRFSETAATEACYP